jgi:hypothetical protein
LSTDTTKAKGDPCQPISCGAAGQQVGGIGRGRVVVEHAGTLLVLPCGAAAGDWRLNTSLNPPLPFPRNLCKLHRNW